MTHPSAPYKGLSYYTSDDAPIFAARGNDAARCARLLTGRASVLMLHGRTGCGKSSFLRAALKPLLERASTGMWFASTDDQFTVVRSGLTPLREIAKEVYDLVQRLMLALPDQANELRQVLGECESRDHFVRTRGDSADLMVRSLMLLGELAPGTPILVVDQAEEIFTLREAAVRPPPDTKTPDEQEKVTALLDSVVRARVEYMNLLRVAAATALGVKFLISLRTEYKGLFEDELRRGISTDAGMRLAGFHLDDLDRDGLVEAIRKPGEYGATDAGGFGVYKFRYAPEVAERIADRLVHPEAVPMGGVLPTLQVVCSRLYEQTKQSRSEPNANWTIRLTDLERLGNLDNQIEVYLRERLEEMFVRLSSQSNRDPMDDEAAYKEEDRTKEIDKWYRLLERLVKVQGDGRAVTRQLKRERVRAHARDLECRNIETALSYLANEAGILRAEGPDDDNKLYSLGHDSIGLAIQKWSVTYKDLLNPSMAMDMNSPRDAAKLSAEHLFPEDSQPALFTIIVPRDLLWDHQIPFFAAARHLTDRVGIRFVSKPALVVANSKDVKAGDTTRARNWSQLSERILAHGAGEGRMLVTSERGTFPPRQEPALWTDVAVSDLFFGNGLVGPVIPGLSPVRPSVADITDDAKKVETMRRLLARTIRHLVEKKATIYSYDLSANSMIQLAAALAHVEVPLDAIKFDRNRPPEFAGENDELFARLARHENSEQYFMVGTAYGRALASHQGYVTYFDCKDLTWLIDPKRAGDHGYAGDFTDSGKVHDGLDLFQLYRDSFFHTVWQLNVPHAQWRRIEHYPLVMRLAGACYFTADYIRSFADDFVRHLYDWHAHNFEAAGRVSRETIREVLRDCFQFLTFEENPRLLFDPDSRLEFNPRDPKGILPSTVRDIHVELIGLRKRTVDLFNEVCEKLEQLERLGRNSRQNIALRRAKELRAFAWENFRIYNYFDSARLMLQALDSIEEVVDRRTRELWEQSAIPESAISLKDAGEPERTAG